MKSLEWGLRSLARQPLRTGLSLAGIAVAAAMLLDMVMLSGGIDKSFSDLLLGRGYQIRLTPKGTLPFDTEATLSRASAIVGALRSDPAVESAGPVLGTAIYGRVSDTLITLFGYGIDPTAQGLYRLSTGHDLTPGDSSGVLLSEIAATRLGAGGGDTVTLVGRLDPQVVTASVGTVLPLMQRLARQEADDRVSLLVVKVRDDAAVPRVAARLRERFPGLEVNSVADLVVQFKQRLVYFRQLSYILGSMSVIVTVLLIATLMTITVHERLGEIATLRAIGVSRVTIVRQVAAEGTVMTVVGAALGVGLGLLTARRLDAILTSFPGLPAAFSFFVPRLDTLRTAAIVLLLTGSLAGLYPAWLAARTPIARTLREEAT